MANSAGVRQDKVRFIVADLETTVGTFLFNPSSPSGSELRVPARAESRLAPVDGEVISNSEALDGYAGEIASTRGAVGMGGMLVTELRSNSVTNVFPTHVKQLLASGFEATSYTGGTFTLVLNPSTKAITNWPGETGGTRSPASMSIVEALIDGPGLADASRSGSTDEWLGAMGAVLATKINLGTNGLVTYESTITGQVAGDLFLNVSDTDLSGFGDDPSGQGKDPIVVKGATLAVTYWDDGSHVGGTTITPDRFRNLAIDLAPNIVRHEDPTATNGFAVSPVFYDGAIGVDLEFADSSDYDGSVGAGTIMAGFKSQRGFLSIELTLTLFDTTVDQTIKYALPRVQYDAERVSAEGARAFTFQGRAVRAERGNSTSPFTVTYVHGTT